LRRKTAAIKSIATLRAVGAAEAVAEGSDKARSQPFSAMSEANVVLEPSFRCATI